MLFFSSLLLLASFLLPDNGLRKITVSVGVVGVLVAIFLRSAEGSAVEALRLVFQLRFLGLGLYLALRYVLGMREPLKGVRR